MSTQRPKVFVFLNKYQILMLSLLIIKFHVIHLNPASCKCCNTVPQTLLLDSHGYSPYPKKFTRSNQGPDKLCHWRNYLGGTGKCEFLSSVTEQMGMCTCSEVWQCAGRQSHGRFSGKQSHASFEGYTHINPFQLQQIHSGGEGKLRNGHKISTCHYTVEQISSPAMTSESHCYLPYSQLLVLTTVLPPEVQRKAQGT